MGKERSIRPPSLEALRTDVESSCRKGLRTGCEWSAGTRPKDRLSNGEQSFWLSGVPILHTIPTQRGSHLESPYTFWNRFQRYSLQSNPRTHPRCQMYSHIPFPSLISRTWRTWIGFSCPWNRCYTKTFPRKGLFSTQLSERFFFLFFFF